MHYLMYYCLFLYQTVLAVLLIHIFLNFFSSSTRKHDKSGFILHIDSLYKLSKACHKITFVSILYFQFSLIIVIHFLRTKIRIDISGLP